MYRKQDFVLVTETQISNRLYCLKSVSNLYIIQSYIDSYVHICRFIKVNRVVVSFSVP